MPQGSVLFVDATQEIKKTKSKSGMAGTIAPETIAKICSVVEKQETVEGFSCVVHQSDIREKDFNLVPSTYIPTAVEEDNITMEEVDAQLAELYRQLSE